MIWPGFGRREISSVRNIRNVGLAVVENSHGPEVPFLFNLFCLLLNPLFRRTLKPSQPQTSPIARSVRLHRMVLGRVLRGPSDSCLQGFVVTCLKRPKGLLATRLALPHGATAEEREVY